MYYRSNVESSLGLIEVGDFLSWFVIFGLVLSSKLQIELSEIRRSRNGVSRSSLQQETITYLQLVTEAERHDHKLAPRE